MGRKSREKKERLAVKKCNITMHEVEEDGDIFRVQEYHPEGSEHMDHEIFNQMKLVAVAHHKKIEDILSKLVYNFSTHRFAIAVRKDYLPGDHDVPVFSYPPLSEKEMKKAESLVNEV